MAGKSAAKGVDGSSRPDAGITVAVDYAGRPKKEAEGCSFLGAGFFLVLFVAVLAWLIRDSHQKRG